jgi:hypothetical protein
VSAKIDSESLKIAEHDRAVLLHETVEEAAHWAECVVLRALRAVQRRRANRAMPVVPCVQVISGQPPIGGVPRGIDTVPDTAIGLPSALRE